MFCYIALVWVWLVAWRLWKVKGYKPVSSPNDWAKPVAVAALASIAAGAISWLGGKLDALVMWQQRTQTTLEVVCKQLEEKKGIDERQDRDIQRILNHLDMPPSP